MILEALVLATLIHYPGVTLVPGSGNVWTDGVDVWGGNPACKDLGFLLQPGSVAIDYVNPEEDQTLAILPGVDCPAPGINPSGCREWFGKKPDAGACEFVSAEEKKLLFPVAGTLPKPPSAVRVQ